MSTFTSHPAANVFPLMESENYKSLKADIEKHGQRLPIVVSGKFVLDGRNRLRACRELKIKPKTQEWKPGGNGDSAIALIWSMNGPRRHLTTDQRAAVGVEFLPALEKEAKERQAAGQQSGGRGRKKHGGNNSTKFKARDAAAALVNVNPHYISDLKRIKTDDPAAFREIKSGRKRLAEVKRQRKEKNREERRKQSRRAIKTAPTIAEAVKAARFSTIVIDPPWDWGDEGDADQLGRARPTYATMSHEELLGFPLGDKADDDCHLYLWITNRSLPKGFSLLDAWGFRYVTCLTWCKPSFGMGNYFRGSTEHILFGVRGSQPLKRKDAGTWFAAPRGAKGHSSKPANFFELVESCSPGPYLEVFARTQRAGWTCWGGEL